MAKEPVSQEESTVYISYKLEGEKAERFLEFKRKLNLENNSEVARKALFDQIEQSERSAAA